MLNNMDESNEAWLPIPGFEGRYDVSNMGRVRSLGRVTLSPKRPPQWVRERILRPATASTGYYSIAMCIDGKRKTYTVHELVALAHIGPRPDGLVIDHIDGDRKNNASTNLRYVAQKLNCRNRSVATGKSGALGVYKNGQGWMAQARYEGRQVHIGTYATIEEASAARREFEEKTDYRGFIASKENLAPVARIRAA